MTTCQRCLLCSLKISSNLSPGSIQKLQSEVSCSVCSGFLSKVRMPTRHVLGLFFFQKQTESCFLDPAAQNTHKDNACLVCSLLLNPQRLEYLFWLFRSPLDQNRCFYLYSKNTKYS
jgi:hypothetical protein